MSVAVLLFLLALAGSVASAAPKAELWDYWLPHQADSQTQLDHLPWQQFLDKYLVTDDPTGIHLVRYKAVSARDHANLQAYLVMLAKHDPRGLSRAEQFAFWVNLYNAATVDLVLQNYPVSSIRRIGGGLFSFGPWDDEIISIADQPLTLNDIEHRILRPIWQDSRIHFVVNCASMGCPNLPKAAINASMLESQLQAATTEFLRHPRGFSIDGNVVKLSAIFKWYGQDFGAEPEALLMALRPYLTADQADSLNSLKAPNIKYAYDWPLNDANNR